MDCRSITSLCPDPTLSDFFPELVASQLLPVYETEDTLCIAAANPFHPRLELLKTTASKALKIIVLTDTAATDFPIEKIVKDALEKQASDIHFFSTKEVLSIQFRHLGQLIPYTQLPLSSTLIQKIKLIAHMDISCQTLPQDGHFSLPDQHVDIRVSSLPSLYGEDLVLRLLPTFLSLKTLETLGFPDPVFSRLTDLLALRSGLILVTGPTGSGKTTTLYAMLLELTRKQGLNIVSIEDPIEMALDGVRQSQINPKIEYTFHAALKAILRQDPDVIMVGEIRDKDTAKTALDAAYTGHLVLATLHTDDIESTLHRLSSFDCDPFLISHCLKGVLTQKLERVSCDCISGCADCNFTGSSKRVLKGALQYQGEVIRF
jgi:type II secretory ATPase GspE/PulE/Tfp pilus assembly ATPase PilB-like protein